MVPVAPAPVAPAPTGPVINVASMLAAANAGMMGMGFGAGAVQGIGAAAAQAAQLGVSAGGANERHYEAELEINEFPQHARWKVGSSSY